MYISSDASCIQQSLYNCDQSVSHCAHAFHLGLGQHLTTHKTLHLYIIYTVKMLIVVIGVARHYVWGALTLSSPSLPSPSLPLPLLSPLPPPLPSPPLRSRPPLLRLGGLGERFSSPSGSGRSPAAKRYLVNFRLAQWRSQRGAQGARAPSETVKKISQPDVPPYSRSSAKIC